MSTVLLKIYFWENCWLNYNWPSAELVQISKFKFSDLCKSKTCWNPLPHESQPAPTMKSVGRGEASGALGGQKRLPKRKKGQSKVPPLQASHCHCHALGLRMSNISVLNFTANFNPISLVKVLGLSPGAVSVSPELMFVFCCVFALQEAWYEFRVMAVMDDTISEPSNVVGVSSTGELNINHDANGCSTVKTFINP